MNFFISINFLHFWEFKCEWRAEKLSNFCKTFFKRTSQRHSSERANDKRERERETDFSSEKWNFSLEARRGERVEIFTQDMQLVDKLMDSLSVKLKIRKREREREKERERKRESEWEKVSPITARASAVRTAESKTITITNLLCCCSSSLPRCLGIMRGGMRERKINK